MFIGIRVFNFETGLGAFGVDVRAGTGAWSSSPESSSEYNRSHITYDIHVDTGELFQNNKDINLILIPCSWYSPHVYNTNHMFLVFSPCL